MKKYDLLYGDLFSVSAAGASLDHSSYDTNLTWSKLGTHITDRFLLNKCIMNLIKRINV